jgi:hypothetical protein
LGPAVVGGVICAMSTAWAAMKSDRWVASLPFPVGAGRTAPTRYWYLPGCSITRSYRVALPGTPTPALHFPSPIFSWTM